MIAIPPKLLNSRTVRMTGSSLIAAVLRVSEVSFEEREKKSLVLASPRTSLFVLATPALESISPVRTDLMTSSFPVTRQASSIASNRLQGMRSAQSPKCSFRLVLGEVTSSLMMLVAWLLDAKRKKFVSFISAASPHCLFVIDMLYFELEGCLSTLSAPRLSTATTANEFAGLTSSIFLAD